jgi:hypothetical protein
MVESGYEGHHNLIMKEVRRYSHGIDYLQLVPYLQLHSKLLLLHLHLHLHYLWVLS